MFENEFSPAGRSVNVARQRILVVEDEPAIRSLNTRVLIGSGYLVDAAEDGAVAWAALQVNQYDLMVTDNQMPAVTGLELLMKLHAVRMDLPVIMASGTLPQDELARQPWLQPAAVLLKPYNVEALVRTVKNVLAANAGAPGNTVTPYIHAARNGVNTAVGLDPIAVRG